MINSIIEAIAVAINAEFGDGYKIHDENVKQGFTEPCFFVSCVNPTHERFLSDRFFRENPFVIQYFPENKQAERQECNGVADRLEMCLEWITVTGDPVMASRMHYEIIDGILNFFVNYNFFVIRTPEKSMMETLNIHTTEKAVN